MGSSSPKLAEHNGVNCFVCNIYLPPCRDRDDYHDEYIDRVVDVVLCHVFLNYSYYRPTHRAGEYYCPTCFYKPREDYLRQQAEENRRREEERRREEAERIQREEQQRQYEEQMRQEMQRREEEARRERERQEQLRREAEKREAERLRRQQEQQEFEESMAEKEAVADKFASWRRSRREQRQERVQIAEPYNNMSALPHADALVDYEALHLYEQDFELWSEEDLSGIEEDEGTKYDFGEEYTEEQIVSKIIAVILAYNPKEGEEIDVAWLKIAQTQLIYNYAKIHHLNHSEVEVLTYFITEVRYNLSDKEILILSKILCFLAQTHPLDYEKTPTTLDDELPGRFMIMLLLTAYNNGYQSSQSAINCVETLASAVIMDKDLVTMIKEAKFKYWNAFDRFMFIRHSDGINLSYTDQKKIMVLIQAYDISPIVVDKAMAKRNITEIMESLIDYIENEPNTHLIDLLNEIRSTKLIEDETLDKVEDITKKAKKILESFNIQLDYEQRLTGDLVNAKDIFKRCGSGNTLDHDELASALTTMCCVIKKSQGYCPRDTQLVTLTILIVSGNTSVSRLLEVMTGEGKSTVIAMFAAILAIQGKHVDIITSSPILALRDAEEWESFYDILELTATHNTDIDLKTIGKSDESRRETYRHPIIYGTLGNFAADILREEFELKEIRSGRRFDAVIADEVDLLMLDEGVQFTYLSHDSPVLHHLEPVLATVWAVIGQYIPVITTVGHALYMGGAKLFSDIIFESINPEICSVEDSSQFLIIANQAGLIDEQTVDKLMFDDEQSRQGEISESKKEAMSTITKDALVALIPKLENYLPYNFEAYKVNHTGKPEPCYASKISEAEAALPEDERLPVIRLLLLDNGLACTLSNEEELKEGTTAKIEDSIVFTSEADSARDVAEGKPPKLQLPEFLKQLVLNQLPEYISSAFRCLEMIENREYTISKLNRIVPVDFLNSGVMQLNKKWGQGLQQMLEMKHKLCVSSMSVVTNFMSHVELFTRYKDNGMIYGLSGTLGIDSPDTAKLLKGLFHVHPCTIPTFKRRKLFENPAMIVEGGKQIWYAKIMDVINAAVKKESWRSGRAVLVLCEDIKIAIDLKSHIVSLNNWSEDKVHLYAHSDSNELQAIKHNFSAGEVVIATNLAGRGTNIKLTDEVNYSGGLLCLVTFLPRNRRVELQAFGRTARKGKPGSVQCVLHASSLAPAYRGHNITEIRKLRAKKEEDRLDLLMNTEVKEVQVKETLFKAHCNFLKTKHESINQRNDKEITIDAINENWGEWLLMKSSEIRKLEIAKLSTELTQDQGNWPMINFYHDIKYGNRLVSLDEEDESGLREAHRLYSDSITLEPTLTFIAYHNRAYVTILKADDDYIEAAMADLRKAEECLMPYISEIGTISQCTSLVNLVQPRMSKPSKDVTNEEGDSVPLNVFAKQMEIRMQIIGFVRDKIREAIGKLEEYKDDDVEAEPAGIFSLIPDRDYATNQELYGLWHLGMEVVFSVKKKPRFCWEGLVVILLGVVEIVAGVLLAVLTVGAAANIGMGLIAEGISDCIDGVVALVTGEFSWAEWGITKAIGLAASLVSGGVSKFLQKGFKAVKVAVKIGKQLKAVPKVAKSTWRVAAKQNFKKVMKHVGKEMLEQAVMKGVEIGQDELLELIYDKISNECKKIILPELQRCFTSGYLSEVVQSEFIVKLPKSYADEDKMSPMLKQRACKFFKEVGQAVVASVCEDPTIRGIITQASSALLNSLSEKHKKGSKFIDLIESAVMASMVAKAVADVKGLLDKLVPETEKICREFITQETTSSAGDINKNSHLQCVKALKNELADHMGDVYGDIVSDSLQQNLGTLMNRLIDVGINKVRNTTLKTTMKRDEMKLKEIEAGHSATFIRSMDPASYSTLPSVARSMVKGYSTSVTDLTKAGSILEMKVAAEHFRQGVTIYKERKGKFVKHCSINSSKGDPGINLKVIYTPPENKDGPGHYDTYSYGQVIKIESEDSNCLFQAYATGRKPHLIKTPQGLEELKAEAIKVRKVVAGVINENPELWAEFIAHQLELARIRKGERFSVLAEGRKNLKTRVHPDTYDEFIHNNKRHTLYTQVNGVRVQAVRTYEKNLAVDANGYLMSADGTPEPQMISMTTKLEGMNLYTNVGRCYHTLPVSGMPERKGGKAKDSCVLFHIGPSNAGGNAGNAYANAVMTSANFKRYRHAWDKEMKKKLGNTNFTVEGKITFEPLVPQSFSEFLKKININRRVAGKPVIDATNENALKQRFEEMSRIDPRAVRVKKMEYIITDSAGNIEHDTRGSDVELFVPESFTNPNQSYQLPGEDLIASHPKVIKDYINVVPGGNQAAHADPTVKQQHDEDVNAYKLAHIS